jgi:hypothetical protein
MEDFLFIHIIPLILFDKDMVKMTKVIFAAKPKEHESNAIVLDDLFSMSLSNACSSVYVVDSGATQFE